MAPVLRRKRIKKEKSKSKRNSAVIHSCEKSESEKRARKTERVTGNTSSRESSKFKRTHNATYSSDESESENSTIITEFVNGNTSEAETKNSPRETLKCKRTRIAIYSSDESESEENVVASNHSICRQEGTREKDLSNESSIKVKWQEIEENLCFFAWLFLTASLSQELLAENEKQKLMIQELNDLNTFLQNQNSGYVRKLSEAMQDSFKAKLERESFQQQLDCLKRKNQSYIEDNSTLSSKLKKFEINRSQDETMSDEHLHGSMENEISLLKNEIALKVKSEDDLKNSLDILHNILSEKETDYEEMKNKLKKNWALLLKFGRRLKDKGLLNEEESENLQNLYMDQSYVIEDFELEGPEIFETPQSITVMNFDNPKTLIKEEAMEVCVSFEERTENVPGSPSVSPSIDVHESSQAYCNGDVGQLEPVSYDDLKNTCIKSDLSDTESEKSSFGNQNKIRKRCVRIYSENEDSDSELIIDNDCEKQEIIAELKSTVFSDEDESKETDSQRYENSQPHKLNILEKGDIEKPSEEDTVSRAASVNVDNPKLKETFEESDLEDSFDIGGPKFKENILKNCFVVLEPIPFHVDVDTPLSLEEITLLDGTKEYRPNLKTVASLIEIKETPSLDQVCSGLQHFDKQNQSAYKSTKMCEKLKEYPEKSVLGEKLSSQLKSKWKDWLNTREKRESGMLSKSLLLTQESQTQIEKARKKLSSLPQNISLLSIGSIDDFSSNDNYNINEKMHNIDNKKLTVQSMDTRNDVETNENNNDLFDAEELRYTDDYSFGITINKTSESQSSKNLLTGFNLGVSEIHYDKKFENSKEDCPSSLSLKQKNIDLKQQLTSKSMSNSFLRDCYSTSTPKNTGSLDENKEFSNTVPDTNLQYKLNKNFSNDFIKPITEETANYGEEIVLIEPLNSTPDVDKISEESEADCCAPSVSTLSFSHYQNSPSKSIDLPGFHDSNFLLIDQEKNDTTNLLSDPNIISEPLQTNTLFKDISFVQNSTSMSPSQKDFPKRKLCDENAYTWNSLQKPAKILKANEQSSPKKLLCSNENHSISGRLSDTFSSIDLEQNDSMMKDLALENGVSLSTVVELESFVKSTRDNSFKQCIEKPKNRGDIFPLNHSVNGDCEGNKNVNSSFVESGATLFSSKDENQFSVPDSSNPEGYLNAQEKLHCPVSKDQINPENEVERDDLVINETIASEVKTQPQSQSVSLINTSFSSLFNEVDKDSKGEKSRLSPAPDLFISDLFSKESDDDFESSSLVIDDGDLQVSENKEQLLLVNNSSVLEESDLVKGQLSSSNDKKMCDNTEGENVLPPLKLSNKIYHFSSSVIANNESSDDSHSNPLIIDVEGSLKNTHVQDKLTTISETKKKEVTISALNKEQEISKHQAAPLQFVKNCSQLQELDAIKKQPNSSNDKEMYVNSLKEKLPPLNLLNKMFKFSSSVVTSNQTKDPNKIANIEDSVKTVNSDSKAGIDIASTWDSEVVKSNLSELYETKKQNIPGENSMSNAIKTIDGLNTKRSRQLNSNPVFTQENVSSKESIPSLPELKHLNKLFKFKPEEKEGSLVKHLASERSLCSAIEIDVNESGPKSKPSKQQFEKSNITEISVSDKHTLNSNCEGKTTMTDSFCHARDATLIPKKNEDQFSELFQNVFKPSQQLPGKSDLKLYKKQVLRVYSKESSKFEDIFLEMRKSRNCRVYCSEVEHRLFKRFTDSFIIPDKSALLFCIFHYLQKYNYDPFEFYESGIILSQDEICLVTVLFRIEISKIPHLQNVLEAAVQFILQVLLAKSSPLFALGGLCRVFTEICKRLKDSKRPLKFCCDVLKIKHKNSVFYISCVAGIWKEIFEYDQHLSEEEKYLLQAVSFGMKKSLEKLWTYSDSRISKKGLSKIKRIYKNVLKIDSVDPLNSISQSLKTKIEKGLSPEDEYNLTSSFVIFSIHKKGIHTKKTLEDYVIPNLAMYGKEINRKGFEVFCNIYVDILARSPNEEKEEMLINFLENTSPSADIQILRDISAAALIKYHLLKHSVIPRNLEPWFSENRTNPIVKTLLPIMERKKMSYLITLTVENFNIL